MTWEHRDFSFNEGGYLIRPTMVVISLNQHRLWEMVGSPGPPGMGTPRGGVAEQGEGPTLGQVPCKTYGWYQKFPWWGFTAMTGTKALPRTRGGFPCNLA